jgi:hypothetical protein
MTKALAELQTLDLELQARGRVLSLGPGRPRATSLETLVRRQVSVEAEPSLCDVAARGLVRIVQAMIRAFPDNLFWDLDYMVASLLAQAQRAAAPAAALEEQVDAIVALQDQFGHATAISFRYVHDFLYGFDWARWVARDPAHRSSIGPFDARFVDVMRRRGEALLEAIDEGTDSKYPPLSDDRHRNPFGFSRAPRAEIVLHRHLARRSALPVEGWRPNAKPRWREDFTQLRLREAHALGLAAPD